MTRLGLMLAYAVPLAGQVNVLTYQYDRTRAGANSSETTLTPRNVNPAQFGKLFRYPVDGYIYGQPLYVGNLQIAGAMHNVVYVATEHDSVYAFDADGLSSSPLWQVNFLGPGVTTVPWQDTGGCDQIVPEIGITSTPVIDPASFTIYVVAMTKEPNGYVHRLHALDITSGAERQGSPVVIQASVPGTGDGGAIDELIPIYYKQRPGLLLLNGIVYTAWSSHCDGGTYHGWLLGYDVQTLRQVAVYNNTPDGSQASFWAGGAAPAVDESGHIYLAGGNGSFDYSSGGRDLGNSYIKLSTGGGLAVADYFTPFNVDALNDGDTDIGSAGVALLGDEAGSPAHPHLMIAAGKEGRIYLVDRDNMGHWQAGSDQVVQETDAQAICCQFGNPAYFNGLAYFCGAGNGLTAWTVSNAVLSQDVAAQTSMQFGYPGCVATISANGTADAIAWVLDPANILHAFDADNVANELYNSEQNHARDAMGPYVKFSAAMVANGKVYAGTQTELDVYGLLPGAPNQLHVTNAASGQAGVAAPGSVIAVNADGVTINSISAQAVVGGWLVPADIPPGIAILTAGGLSAIITIQDVAPGLYRNGSGRALAVNSDGTVNSPLNPAAAGSEIELFLTGLGGSTDVSVGMAQQYLQVVSVGAADGLPGVDQVAAILPAVAPGDYPLQVVVSGIGSNTAVVSLK